MKSLSCISLALLLVGCSTHSIESSRKHSSSSKAADSRAKEPVQPTLEEYSIERWVGPGTARRFVLTQNGTGYSLTTRSGEVIAKDVEYMKTFGGAFGAISLAVVEDRFLVYPETIKDSKVPDAVFCDMYAVTHVYDLKRHTLLTTSGKYRYHGDIPLRYDMGEIWQLANQVDKLQESHKPQKNLRLSRHTAQYYVDELLSMGISGQEE